MNTNETQSTNTLCSCCPGFKEEKERLEKEGYKVVPMPYDPLTNPELYIYQYSKE